MDRIKKYCIFGLVIGGLYAGCTAAPAVPPPAAPPATEAPTQATTTAEANEPLAERYLIPRSFGAAQPTAEVTSRYTRRARGIACQSILYASEADAQEALDSRHEHSPPERPILWTFAVNFDAGDEGVPFGCFRLYRRSEEHRTFAPIDDGGILVDKCRVVPQSAGMVNFTEGRALFDGQNYVQCDMDIAAWVRHLGAFFEDDDPVKTELNTFVITPTHVYSSFTLVASVVQVEPPASEVPRRLPLVYYKPHPTAQWPTDAPALTVRETKIGKVTFPVQHCGDLDDGQPTDNQFEVLSTAPGFWWFDLQPLGNDPPVTYLEYVYREESPDLTEPPGCIALSDEGSIQIPPLQFWIGPATLYIGYDPKEETTFTGTLDGVLVDPTNSKPGK